MRIGFAEGVFLQAELTDRMMRDYMDCRRQAEQPGVGKDCGGCSLDVDVLGCGLCELPAVRQAVGQEGKDASG